MVGESVEIYQETSAGVRDIIDVDDVSEKVDWTRNDIDAVEVPAAIAIPKMINNEICADTKIVEEGDGYDVDEESTDYSSKGETDI